MKKLLTLSFVCAIGVLAQSASSKDALNRGVAAFKNARYADAVAAFEESARLNPANPAPRLYLATTFMSQWIPGGDSPENLEFAARAESEFRKVLDTDPNNTVALSSMASLYFRRGKALDASKPERSKQFDEAEIWYKRLSDVNPDDKTAHYSLGVIAWERFYPELIVERSRLGMRLDDPGPLPDVNSRHLLRSRFGVAVEQGMANLRRAIQIDPQYDDAMAYLNLLYRERADLSDSKEDYQRDITAADALVSSVLEARKRKAESANGFVSAAPVPPIPPTPGVERIRVGGNVQAANLSQKTPPVYPALAKQARVQGTVRFSVLINRDGQVANLQLMSGHPLLVAAATEAVRTWVYKPTMLNGQPCEVITQVDVNFTLSN